MLAWLAALGLVAAVLAPDAGPALAGAGRLVAGARHTCLLPGDGTARCWGSNRDGQLGDGTREDRSAPTAVVGLTDAVELAAGSDHTCARRRGGEVVCWGLAEDGQLGDGQRFVGDARQRASRLRSGERLAAATPSAVVGLAPVSRLVAGDDLTCGIAGGEAWCWGTRPRSDTSTPKPARLAGFAAIDELAIGRSYICARSGGAVSCLAEDRKTWKMATTPAPIAGITDALAIGGGSDHLCVVHAAGRVACVGTIAYAYELGRGLTSFAEPTAIAELDDVVALMSAGVASHACALRQGGEVRCWGDGFEGQLGHGLYQPWRRPVAVSGLQRPQALAAGVGHTCALREDGAVLCWGANGQGQLGWAPAPVEIPELNVSRRGHDAIASQLRELVRGSATPVEAWPAGASGPR